MQTNLRSPETPTEAEIGGQQFSKETLNSQASDRCLFAERSAFNKPQAVSAGFYLGHCLDTHGRELSELLSVSDWNQATFLEQRVIMLVLRV